MSVPQMPYKAAWSPQGKQQKSTYKPVPFNVNKSCNTGAPKVSKIASSWPPEKPPDELEEIAEYNGDGEDLPVCQAADNQKAATQPNIYQQYKEWQQQRLHNSGAPAKDSSPQKPPNSSYQQQQQPVYTFRPHKSPQKQPQQPPSSYYQQATSYQQPRSPGYQQPTSPGYQQPTSPGYQPRSPGYQQPTSPGYQQVRSPGYQQPTNPGYQQSTGGYQHPTSYYHQQQNVGFYPGQPSVTFHPEQGEADGETQQNITVAANQDTKPDVLSTTTTQLTLKNINHPEKAEVRSLTVKPVQPVFQPSASSKGLAMFYNQQNKNKDTDDYPDNSFTNRQNQVNSTSFQGGYYQQPTPIIQVKSPTDVQPQYPFGNVNATNQQPDRFLISAPSKPHPGYQPSSAVSNTVPEPSWNSQPQLEEEEEDDEAKSLRAATSISIRSIKSPVPEEVVATPTPLKTSGFKTVKMEISKTPEDKLEEKKRANFQKFSSDKTTPSCDKNFDKKGNIGHSGYPRSQSPTVTLLQKKRVGQIRNGAFLIGDQQIETPRYKYPEKPRTEKQPAKESNKTCQNVNVGLIADKSNSPDKNKQEWYKEMYNSMHRVKKPEEINTYEPTYTFPESDVDSEIEMVGYEDPKTNQINVNTYSTKTWEKSKDVYKRIQRGEDIPFEGLRFPAPEKKERHWNSQQDMTQCGHKDVLELAQRKELLKKLYEEEKAQKIKEKQAMHRARCHSDNLLPRQKSPIPKDRFEEGYTIPPPEFYKHRQQSVRGKAKAKYNFTAQSRRELSLRKGDVVYITRQADKNWYVGERHGMVGLFPVNYVEIIVSLVEARKAALTNEGLAKARYTFTAQTPMELSFVKGELVNVLRRVDHNWYEGKNDNGIGIFPASYVDVIKEPDTPLVTPVSSAVPSRVGTPGPLSPGSTISYAPTLPDAPDPLSFSPNSQSSVHSSASQYGYKQEFIIPNVNTHRRGQTRSNDDFSDPWNRPSSAPYFNQLTPRSDSRASYGDPFEEPRFTYSSSDKFATMPTRNKTMTSHSPVYNDYNSSLRREKPSFRHNIYKAVYTYRPQNEDELELYEGDLVNVLEKCEDGWYIGTSERTKDFGTFPGNYVRPTNS